MNIPRGLNDLLPDEVIKRRFLEKKISQIFNQWGYREIIVPTFELYEILSQGSGLIMKKEMIKFIDRQGNIVVLRPEMTKSIARLVSTKMQSEPKPLRICYVGNVFRHDNKTRTQKEFCQAGVELIGINNTNSDAEIIALAVECLKNSGLKRFFIDINHVDFFNGIMESIKVKEERKQSIKNAILNKDFVLLEKILSLEDIKDAEKELILKIPTLRGGREILGEVKKIVDNKLSLSALKEIEEVYHLLETYGLEDHILIDLGIIRNYDYYTGIIFEGYTDYLGFPVCGGGRYDNLSSKFNGKMPSTGFAIGIEKLATVLEKEDVNALKVKLPPKYLVYYAKNKNYFQKAMIIAKKIREKGAIVELEVSGKSFEEALNYAHYYKIDYILKIENKESNCMKRIEVTSGKEENITYE